MALISRIRKLFRRPIEEEIDPEELMDQIYDMTPREVAEVLDNAGYGYLEAFLEDNPFVYDVLTEHEEDEILAYCEEEGIEDEEECFSYDNLFNYVRERYPTVEDLLTEYGEVFDKTVEGYRGYLVAELLRREVYRLIDEEKFDPQNRRDLEALKRLIQRLPLSSIEKEEVYKYVLERL